MINQKKRQPTIKVYYAKREYGWGKKKPKIGTEVWGCSFTTCLEYTMAVLGQLQPRATTYNKLRQKQLSHFCYKL